MRESEMPIANATQTSGIRSVPLADRTLLRLLATLLLAVSPDGGRIAVGAARRRSSLSGTTRSSPCRDHSTAAPGWITTQSLARPRTCTHFKDSGQGVALVAVNCPQM